MIRCSSFVKSEVCGVGGGGGGVGISVGAGIAVVVETYFCQTPG